LILTISLLISRQIKGLHDDEMEDLKMSSAKKLLAKLTAKNNNNEG